MTEKMASLIKAVRKHAQAHYEEDGWDYVVESFDDNELAEVIGNASTPELAIKRVKREVSIINDVREDVQGEARGEF